MFRDANTHLPLVQQLDEIATRHENDDDGSIRHLVFSVQLPRIPANGTYTIEIVKQTGTYTAGGKQTLTALATAHDLKLHLTDVRNQNDSTRGSGSLTFDINRAAANTGRDTPRKCATGPVRDCWIVAGPPIDDATKKPDPLLYVTCYLDLTTSSTDQTSLGPVRHVCRVDNSWSNVAADRTGNSGAPGPAGYANDPQALSYRPQVLDGDKTVLSWSNLDQTVGPSAYNPATGVWTIPGSTGNNSWYLGASFRYTNSGGSPPSGMTSGQLLFDAPPSPPDYTQVQFAQTILLQPGITATTRGSSTHSFSFRVWHTHFAGWYTLNATGLENWTSATIPLYTSPLLPKFSDKEQTYWKETGVVPPLRLTYPASRVPDPTNYSGWLQHLYAPMSKDNVAGGAGVGGRPDIGYVNEYWSQAWALQDAAHWQRARAFALVEGGYPFGSLLNEATGRIPALNNGPPGPNHVGTGGSYPVLGSPSPHTQIKEGVVFNNVVAPLENVPVSGCGRCSNYSLGPWAGSYGYGNDHEPSFLNGMYQVFGSRHYLDAIYLAGNRAVYQVGDPLQQVTVGGNTYNALFWGCCERRGAFWALRDEMLAAAMGGDNNPERTYFNDILHENYWYGQTQTDNPRRPYYASIGMPLSGFYGQGFMDAYGAMASFGAYAMLRDPLAANWLPRFFRGWEASCGDTLISGSPSSFFCVTYGYDASIHDSRAAQIYNTNDASDWGSDACGGCKTTFTAGSGTIAVMPGGMPTWIIPSAGSVKFVWCPTCGTNTLPDQLRTDTWYTVANPDRNAGTFQVMDPHTGSPFPRFTADGSPFGGAGPFIKFRWALGQVGSTGWSNPGYACYAQAALAGLADLQVPLGLSSAAMTQIWNTINRRGLVNYANGNCSTDVATQLLWDPNVTVP